MSIAVLKKYRNNGVGKNLINSIKKKNLPEISLYVLESNINAIAFYKNLNFKIIKKLDNYYESLNKSAYYMSYKNCL